MFPPRTFATVHATVIVSTDAADHVMQNKSFQVANLIRSLHCMMLADQCVVTFHSCFTLLRETRHHYSFLHTTKAQLLQPASSDDPLEENEDGRPF